MLGADAGCGCCLVWPVTAMGADAMRCCLPCPAMLRTQPAGCSTMAATPRFGHSPLPSAHRAPPQHHPTPTRPPPQQERAALRRLCLHHRRGGGRGPGRGAQLPLGGLQLALHPAGHAGGRMGGRVGLHHRPESGQRRVSACLRCLVLDFDDLSEGRGVGLHHRPQSRQRRVTAFDGWNHSMLMPCAVCWRPTTEHAKPRTWNRWPCVGCCPLISWHWLCSSAARA